MPDAPRSMRPRSAIVVYRGIPYRLDLIACRQALVRRQVAGEFDSAEGLAEATGVSRSTVSRFFGGRATSLGTTLAILDKLRLQFDEVATPCADADPDGSP
jgi:hypothetical protein